MISHSSLPHPLATRAAMHPVTILYYRTHVYTVEYNYLFNTIMVKKLKHLPVLPQYFGYNSCIQSKEILLEYFRKILWNLKRKGTI